MNWAEIRNLFPNKWLVIKILTWQNKTPKQICIVGVYNNNNEAYVAQDKLGKSEFEIVSTNNELIDYLEHSTVKHTTQSNRSDNDTYQQRVQLGASQQRYEDAQALQEKNRWNGTIYLGGYAIECALKALICLEAGKSNFLDTKAYQDGSREKKLHSLTWLLKQTSLENTISLDRTAKYKKDWQIITQRWRNHSQLRYSKYNGNQKDADEFIEAVKNLHLLLLERCQ